jgi:hypothetical protein
MLLGAALCFVVPGHATSPDNIRLLDILVAAYPERLERHEEGVLVWKDGSRMTFDDRVRQRDFGLLLNNPSLRDQFYAPYPVGQIVSPPGLNIDPGRVRNQPFFAKMYGDCRKGEVERHLVNIAWLPKKWGRALRVTRVNGVSDQLNAVSAELDRLPANFDQYLYPTAGTFVCRTIAGTERLSPHGFGIAIDLSTAKAHYWRWAKPDAVGRYTYNNAIPMEVVAIFEKHGFIWGGRWYHYDTMHFEYRPELIRTGGSGQFLRR